MSKYEYKQIFVFDNLLDLNTVYSNCTDFDVRFINGASPNEGKVQICVNGVWGLLCSSSVDRNDARVVCSELGYQTGGKLQLHINILNIIVSLI